MSPFPHSRSGTTVLGAGSRGLLAALRALANGDDARSSGVIVVDKAARPGGAIATQRSNGFVCELGPIAFDPAEIDPLLAALAAIGAHAPTPVPLAAHAATGYAFDGERLHRVDVSPRPVSFRTGNEELVQAFRRALGDRLLLGRAAVDVTHAGERFVVTLGGEVPTALDTDTLVVALPDAEAARLLARFDPALHDLAARLRDEPVAMALLGGAGELPALLQCYGIAPTDPATAPFAEVVCAGELFPHRTLPGRFLVRVELTGEQATGDEPDVLARAEHVLRDLAKHLDATIPALGFHKLHRTTRPLVDGARIECRTRLEALPKRVPGLHLG